MFTVFNGSRACGVYLHKDENICIRYALEDMQSDILKISGQKAKIYTSLPTEHETGVLVAGSVKNPAFKELLISRNIEFSDLENNWEKYMIKTYGANNENMVICGSDERGTMWGIYDFCENQLGVDPMYYWTDSEPLHREELVIPQADVCGQPDTYKFRGWFINDEDLLMFWKKGGTRHIDYPLFTHVIHEDIMKKIIETALRLKQNFLIPSSYIDIDNPVEENIVRMVTQRGLFISQHHQEPLGATLLIWENFWKKRGEEIPEASYIKNPDKFEEFWTFYSSKWAAYPNVVWQLGLRGRYDQPIWNTDSNMQVSQNERGKVLSEVFKKQIQIIERVTGSKHNLTTATLWMEGAQLHRDGVLTFPEDTIIILSDNGAIQLWEDDFYQVQRQQKYHYGVYYHVGFWSAGPHLAQAVNVEKIYECYKEAVEKNDTYISVLNVGNIREFVLGVRAVADITWNYELFDLNSYIQKWCIKHFGAEHAKEIAALYKAFYSSYHEISTRDFGGLIILMDGVLKQTGEKIIDAMSCQESYNKPITLYRSFKFDNLRRCAQYCIDAAGRCAETLAALIEKADKISRLLPLEKKDFFIDNLIVQMEIMYGLNTWVCQLAYAADAVMDNNREEYLKRKDNAVKAMEKLLLDITKAERGKWKGWYTGDVRVCLTGLLDKTKGMK